MYIHVPECTPNVPVLSCQVVLFIKQHFTLHPKISMYHRALLKTDTAVDCVIVF